MNINTSSDKQVGWIQISALPNNKEKQLKKIIASALQSIIV